MTKVIDAALFCEMIISGANNLINNKEIVDSLNVFPVPDGDTGTNMSLTFLNAARAVEKMDFGSVSEASTAVAKATLRGARGNSGVILSQIFRGISKELENVSRADIKKIAKAISQGCDTAYRAVMKPTEGTILTVIRSIAQAGLEFDGTETDEFFKAVTEKGREALVKTQEMLPQLTQAGVVDAGGQGLIFIFEGFVKALIGEPVRLLSPAVNTDDKSVLPQQSIKTEDIRFTYCTEFIINKFDASLKADKLESNIRPRGDCLIVIDDEDIVKIHIHTNHPGYVLEQALKLGELVNIKIENMRQQHTSIVGGAQALADEQKEKSHERKSLGIICVAAGEGLESTFAQLGVDKIVKGGQTMNPSTEDILNAAKEVNADEVIVLPNNKNIILAASQACEIADFTIHVIASKNIPEGIAAMMAYSPSDTCDNNILKMEKALSKVTSGTVTHAVKNTNIDGKDISEGNIIGISGGNILAVSENLEDAAIALICEMADEESEVITIYYGNEITKKQAESLAEKAELAFPDADVLTVSGGQPVYYYIISVE